MKTERIDLELTKLREEHRKLTELKRLREQVAELSFEQSAHNHECKNVFLLATKIISAHFKIPAAVLIGKKRPDWIAWPRQILMTITRELTDGSLSEIGEMTGGRDHGTVIHAIKSVRNRCSIDKRDAMDFNMCRKQVVDALKSGNMENWVKVALIES